MRYVSEVQGREDPCLGCPKGGDVRVHLRRARTVRVSIDANGDYCRQLLHERYGLAAAAGSGR